LQENHYKMKLDKILHFFVGIVIYLLFNSLYLVFLIAGLKEGFDYLKHGKPDYKDFIITVIPAILIEIWLNL